MFNVQSITSHSATKSKGFERFLASLFLISFFLISCKPSIALFDQYAYAQVTSAKVEALNLMDKSTSNYSTQMDEIVRVSMLLNKAMEYEKHRPQNKITTQMWAVLLDRDKHLFGGFLNKWETSQTLSTAFKDELKIQVGEAFDLIAELESAKIKSGDARIQSTFNLNP